MSPARNRLDLRELGLLPGTRTSRDFQLGVDPVILGGATVEIVVADPGATLTVQRIAGGHLVRVDVEATAYGPCARCLADVVLPVSAGEEEFVPSRPEEWEEGDLSPFIEDQVVDVDGLVREAVVLALPSKILCDEACEGLCPQCGAPVGSPGCACGAPVMDDRWARLADVDFGPAREE